MHLNTTILSEKNSFFCIRSSSFLHNAMVNFSASCMNYREIQSVQFPGGISQLLVDLLTENASLIHEPVCNCEVRSNESA